MPPLPLNLLDSPQAPTPDKPASRWRWLIWAALGLTLVIFAWFIWWSQRYGRALTPPPAASFDLGGGQAFRPLDRLSSADIAFSLGRLGQFEELSWIATQAKDSEHLAHLVVASEPVVVKPLTVNSTIRTKADIVVHQPQPGETINSLAVKFAVPADSIRWSNNLQGNTLPADRDLLIPPSGLEGIVYRVGLDDSLDKLAELFQFRRDQVIGFNDLVDEQLIIGELVFLPHATPSHTETPVVAFGPGRIPGRAVSPLPSSTSDTCIGCRPVQAGDVVGKVGNTGWSTGSHLHLEIYDQSGRRTDPWVFLKRQKLVWPVDGRVSDGFDLAHQGLDLAATEGTPIKAIADGQIIYRGCAWEGQRWATFVVVIDHGGYYSLLLHLQAPDNDRYQGCQINRRSSYGRRSVDYDTRY